MPQKTFEYLIGQTENVVSGVNGGPSMYGEVV